MPIFLPNGYPAVDHATLNYVKETDGTRTSYTLPAEITDEFELQLVRENFVTPGSIQESDQEWPGIISNLEAWWAAEDAPYSDGTAATNWSPRYASGGSDYNMNAYSPLGASPVYRATGIGGRPAFDIAAAGAPFVCTTKQIPTGAFTIFVVGTCATSGGRMAAQRANGNPGFVVSPSGANMRFWAGSAGSFPMAQQGMTAGQQAGTTAMVVTGQHTGSLNKVSINGAAYSNSTAASAWTQSTGWLTFGAEVYNLGANSLGRSTCTLAEVIIYARALNDIERFLVEDSLKTKYGIA